MYDDIWQILQTTAVSVIRQIKPDLNERAASRLLAAHLHPDHFSMPIHDFAIEQQLMNWSLGSDQIEAASAFLKFEATHTGLGVARVLLRTHTNRQGVASVTRDARYKVMSPRVMGLFNSDTEQDWRSWLDWPNMIQSWISWSERAPQPHQDTAAGFSDTDRTALRQLQALSTQQALDLPHKQIASGSYGWNRIVLGFYSGLRFLNDQYELQPNRLWAEIDASRTALAVNNLVARWTSVREFGNALASSFLADLGNREFVKADTHVIAVATAALNAPGRVSAQGAIDFTRDLANHIGVPARSADKLMFFACSGQLYLAGLHPNKALIQKSKQDLLTKLSWVNL